MEHPTFLCEFCKKKFTESTILKHIGTSPDCKSYYGSRFIEMKKTKSKEKIKKWRESNKEKELSQQRKIYGKSSEKKEKKRLYYEKKTIRLSQKGGLGIYFQLPIHERND